LVSQSSRDLARAALFRSAPFSDPSQAGSADVTLSPARRPPWCFPRSHPGASAQLFLTLLPPLATFPRSHTRPSQRALFFFRPLTTPSAFATPSRRFKALLSTPRCGMAACSKLQEAIFSRQRGPKGFPHPRILILSGLPSLSQDGCDGTSPLSRDVTRHLCCPAADCGNSFQFVSLPFNRSCRPSLSSPVSQYVLLKGYPSPRPWTVAGPGGVGVPKCSPAGCLFLPPPLTQELQGRPVSMLLGRLLESRAVQPHSGARSIADKLNTRT